MDRARRVRRYRLAALALLVVAVLAIERTLDGVLLALPAVLGMAALAALVTGRVILPAAIAGALACTIAVSSAIKFSHVAEPLTYSDIYYLAATMAEYLVKTYTMLFIGLLAAGAAAVVVLVQAARIPDRPVSRGAAVGVLIGCAALTGLAHATLPNHETVRHEHFTRLFSNLVHTALDHEPGGAPSMAATEVTDEPLSLDTQDTQEMEAGATGGTLPHIVLVQHESVFDPRRLGVPVSRDMARFFDGLDGKARALKVETHGGRSWLSEFSVQTGLSSRSFARDRGHLLYAASGRIKATLANFLARRGYDTLMFYPTFREYVNAGQFYEAAGFNEVLTPEDMGRARDAFWYARDRDFYRAGLDWLAGNRISDDDTPLFLNFVTYGSHGPYGEIKFHDSDAGKARRDIRERLPAAEPELHEYYSRVAATVSDYEYLKRELARLYPDQPFLIVNYGDHQPAFTEVDPAGGTFDLEETFISFDAIGYEPDLARVPEGDKIDVAFVGLALVAAARLPEDRVFAARRRLAASCLADYFGCDHPDKARLHAAMIEEGYMQVRLERDR